MDDKELMILAHLRTNSRKSLVDVANETGIPISTVYDKVRKYEKRIIKKHTCILDFQKIGYNIRAMMLLKASDDEAFKSFVTTNRSINSAFRLNEQKMYLIDCIFMHMAEMEDFLTDMDRCGVDGKSMHFVSEEIVRENFLAKRG